MELSSAPAPLEPLLPLVDERNKKLLHEEIERRVRLQRAKLSRRELITLRFKISVLKAKIRASKYKALLAERNQLITERRNKRRISEINQKLLGISRMVKEYRILAERVRRHMRAIEIEKDDLKKQRFLVKEARTWEAQIVATFRQLKELHHAGVDENGRWFCHTPVIDEIFVKPDAVYFRVRTSTQNIIDRFLGVWRSALPYGVHVTDMISERTLANMSAMCKRTVRVERSGRGHSLFYVISRHDSPDEIPKLVLYQSIIDYYPVHSHLKTPWCFGLTRNRELKWFNFEDYPHILVAGATQGGKSNHINQMIATLVLMNTPQEIQLLLVDLKGGIEFTHWKDLSHLLMPVLTKPEQAIEALSHVRDIMESRLSTFEAVKAKNLGSYRAKRNETLSRVIVFVDEMATLIGLGEQTSRLHNLLRVISSQGRAVGIHLVLCTQHSSVDVLPGWVKTNMYLRISTRMPSISSSMVILDTPTAASLPDLPGRAVASVGRNEVIAQVPYITDEDIARAVRASMSHEKTTIQIQVEEKFNVIEVALARYNGQLSANKMIDDGIVPVRISRNSLRKTINSIVDKGTVEYQGETYVVKRRAKAYYLVKEMDSEKTHPESEDLGVQ